MGEIHTQPTYPKGITFEQVWAALMEDREQMKESRAEYELMFICKTAIQLCWLKLKQILLSAT